MQKNEFIQRVIEPNELQQRLQQSQQQNTQEHYLPVFVGSAESFAQAHIPSAVLIQPAQLVCGIPPAVGKIADQDDLRHLFTSLGIQKNTTIIAYDDEGGGWAGRLIWTLDVINHSKYLFANGGIQAWLTSGLPIEQGYPSHTPIENNPDIAYDFEIDSQQIVQLDDIMTGLAGNSIQVWDARSAAEHSGAKAVAARGGRIPGAKNIDWLELMDKSNHLRLLPLEHIANLAESRGLSLDNQQLTITHCQSHHRSGLSYIVGKMLGLNIKAYDGSWSEWGNLPDTPVETDR